MPKKSKLKQLKSKSNIGIGTSSNGIDIESYGEYESDNLSLVDSEVDSEVDYDTEGDGYFRDDDDGTKLAVSHFAVLVARSLKISQFFSSTDPGLAVNELSNESEDENKSNNEDTTEQDKISKAIEFVNEIIHGSLYGSFIFLSAIIKWEKKIEASEAVTEVVGSGLWLAKCIRKWAKICIE
ncbi:7841_t:CDS:2, partial [Gigaspora margarita]